MRKLAFLGGAGALGVAALLSAPLDVRAADHLDSSTLLNDTGSRMADINDVYAWMTSDGTKVNLALTVSPADDGTRHFGPTVQYVFHVEEHTTFGLAGTERRIICTFTDDTNGQCWVADASNTLLDYVGGDLSVVTGKASASNKFRVFAGRRSDPFFFNLSGFLTAKRTVNNTALTLNAKGCPDVTAAPTVPQTLRDQLQGMPDGTTENSVCSQTDKDCFKTFDVKAIVVQIDKDLLVGATNKYISVWASTHAAP